MSLTASVSESVYLSDKDLVLNSPNQHESEIVDKNSVD
jgi:hypothetical protein